MLLMDGEADMPLMDGDGLMAGDVPGLRALESGPAGCLDGFMLYGRQGEQERVRALLDAARDRLSGALLVVGEPEAGKSALLDEARAQAG